MPGNVDHVLLTFTQTSDSAGLREIDHVVDTVFKRKRSNTVKRALTSSWYQLYHNKSYLFLFSTALHAEAR
jgi:hypothetical protein